MPQNVMLSNTDWGRGKSACMWEDVCQGGHCLETGCAPVSLWEAVSDCLCSSTLPATPLSPSLTKLSLSWPACLLTSVALILSLILLGSAGEQAALWVLSTGWGQLTTTLSINKPRFTYLIFLFPNNISHLQRNLPKILLINWGLLDAGK